MLPQVSLPSNGQVVGGKYSIVRTLGEGGMGVVYEAKHLRLGQRFALKMLKPDIAHDGEAVARFEREARAAAGLTSSHVCRVIDVGSTDEGTPFMVMEFLEGRDLGTELEVRGPLPVGEVVDYVLQACEALEEAHGKGIIHRDLKPENLFLAKDSRGTTLKLLDFGISKVTDDRAVDMTRTQSAIGTPLYMSPEQTRSTKKVDQRTDIWALGVILYELLTANVPFKGENAAAVAVAVAVDRHESLHAVRQDVPPEVEAVIDRALQKQPKDRFDRVRDLASALAPFAADTNRAARWLVSGDVIPPATTSAPSVVVAKGRFDSATTIVDLKSDRRSAWRIVAAILALASIVAAGVLVLRARSPRAEPTAPIGTTDDATATAAAETGAGQSPAVTPRPTNVATDDTATSSASSPVETSSASATAKSTGPVKGGTPRPPVTVHAGPDKTAAPLPTKL